MSSTSSIHRMFALFAVFALCFVAVPASAEKPIAEYDILNEYSVEEGGVVVDEGTTIYLDASESTDPDGKKIVKYYWTIYDEDKDKEINPGKSDEDQTSAQVAFDLDPGTYQITLEVTDDDDEKSTYTRSLEVKETDDSQGYFYASVFIVIVGLALGFIIGKDKFTLKAKKTSQGEISFRERARTCNKEE